MSEAAFKHVKEQRRLCEQCRDRKARFQYRGSVRADRHHTLCFACFRAQREHDRARLLAEGAIVRPFASPFALPRPDLTPRQAAHRRLMLEHLRRCAGDR